MTIERLEQIRSISTIPSDRLVRSQTTSSDLTKKMGDGLPASQVELSASAQHLNIDTSQDIDKSKVHSLQSAISDGRFTIDTDNIAKQLLATLFELS